MTQHPHTPTYPQTLIKQVQEACAKLITLLAEENKALKKKDVTSVERLTPEKDNLSKQIEGILAELKGWADYATDDAKHALKKQTIQMDALMTEMNTLAQKNLALLEANHTATRTFLDVVRRAVSHNTPKAEIYGKQGRIESDNNSPSLLTKSV